MTTSMTRRTVLRGGVAVGLAAGAAAATAGTAGADAGRASGHGRPRAFPVARYGARPDDGRDDTHAIQRAIDAATAHRGPSVVAFERGTYTLTATEFEVLKVTGASNLTIRGATDRRGRPATTLEVNLPLQNKPPNGVHLSLLSCTDTTVESLVLDYNPRFGTSGVIVSVDTANDAVEVDVFDGLPHFDGMRCYSANSWDIATGRMHHVPALTIGTGESTFTNTWTAVPGGEGRRYRIAGFGFTPYVSVGDGMNWHFGIDGPKNLQIIDCVDTRVENVDFPNAIGMCCLAGYNTNLTLRHIRIAPTNGALAVGPRDGFHLSNSRGTLVVDDFDAKGVRWDPLVLRSTLGEITAVDGARRVSVLYPAGAVPMPYEPGDVVTFWSGDEPAERTVASVDRDDAGTTVTLDLDGDVPARAVVGSTLTCSAHEWTTATIRNSTFTDNFGTPLVIMNPHVTIEDCTFVDNAYQVIGLGTTSSGSGPFARDITIRDNTFRSSGWIKKYPKHLASGAITTLCNNGRFDLEAYNSDITITDNVFEDMAEEPFQAAVEVRHARRVHIAGNTYRNVSQRVVVDPATTGEITNEDG
ncbi:hypothetical protein Bcav_1501 [Beutenbergia cavernae DSM 12333]|uniref:Pectate lyase superfamily protein domain-containing protein n=1 Tax=Beutenbergia cavernae (strain ATCC BAA-8 / DSM 12333 / CCUG 43141 / JCM 11478 / NBRC 16432 / NCIMB 13614 / HKI 0122) TaxID=471853 RepID=C5C358_BEUC1|nr:right-handed parallel beta-helix repeat-containing protein [Beutenbergia cavernae]ACQ79757.1 hypothetical protein Bcav_1501 [Beutenbergia cavernae DSM 12333]